MERARARWSELDNGDSTATAFFAIERRNCGNKRVQELEVVAVEVMHDLSADERGQERRMGAKWRTGAAADRPRRRLKISIRARFSD
jgi:hypothetical protein